MFNHFPAIKNGNLYMEKNIRKCHFNRCKLELSLIEFETLYIIAKEKGKIIKTEDLIKQCSVEIKEKRKDDEEFDDKSKFEIKSKTLNKRIERVNKKFKKVEPKYKIIINERGIGYYLNTDIVNALSIHIYE